MAQTTTRSVWGLGTVKCLRIRDSKGKERAHSRDCRRSDSQFTYRKTQRSALMVICAMSVDGICVFSVTGICALIVDGICVFSVDGICALSVEGICARLPPQRLTVHLALREEFKPETSIFLLKRV